MNKHYPLYAITILWPQVKEASTRVQIYANTEVIKAIRENRTICKDLNIHHTSVTLKTLQKIRKKIKERQCKKFQNRLTFQ